MGQGARLIVLILSVLWLSGAQAFAASSSADALFDKGKAYHDGLGVTQNFDVARAFYERAAAAGSTDAQLNLGYLYFVGEGVPRNYLMARQWYERAAKAGDGSAVQNLAMMDARGLGLPQKIASKTRVENAPDATTQFKVTSLPAMKISSPEFDSYLFNTFPWEAQARKSLGPFYAQTAIKRGVVLLPIENLATSTETSVASAALVAPHSQTMSGKAPVLASRPSAELQRSRKTEIAALSGLVFILTLISLILFSDFYVKNRKRATRKLAVEFFEQNRRTVRDAYFRYSAELRDMRYAESKLDNVLSVLIVRYVLLTYGADEPGKAAKSGQLVDRICKLAGRHPAKSRHLALSLAPHIFDLIRSDIRALDKEHETAPTAPSFYQAPAAVPPRRRWKPRVVKAS
jgi:hypothetical protein